MKRSNPDSFLDRNEVKIYLDVSCLNRPFDDQSQSRIRLESAAVTIILERMVVGAWECVSSRMAEIETLAIPDESRRRRVLLLLPEHRIELSKPIFDKAREHIQLGIQAADAVHLAAAELLSADVFLTCDDRLLRKCRRVSHKLAVKVANPLQWLQEQENESNLE